MVRAATGAEVLSQAHLALHTPFLFLHLSKLQCRGPHKLVHRHTGQSSGPLSLLPPAQAGCVLKLYPEGKVPKYTRHAEVVPKVPRAYVVPSRTDTQDWNRRPKGHSI